MEGYRCQRPHHLSWVDHDWKIRNRRQRRDIGKYSFITRNIQLWNKLTMNALGSFPSKPSTFRKTVREVISEVKGIQSEVKIQNFQEKGLKCNK